MAKWDIVAFLGVAVMTVSASVGIYLSSVGFDVSFHTIIAIWIGAMISTVAFVSWGEEKGVEEDFMKELVSKYRAPAAKKTEKIKTEVYAKSFKGMTSAFSYVIPFFTGFSLCALIIGFVVRSVEAIFISVVLTIFLVWLYRWVKKTQEKWKKFRYSGQTLVKHKKS
jgi:Flp pilus assembly protein TadB